MNITELRSLAKQLRMKGYSNLRKDDLVYFIVSNLSMRVPQRPPAPAPKPPTPKPPIPRPPEFKPYQLKPKRGTNTGPQTRRAPQAETAGSLDLKKLKRMKKKLGELNRKIKAL